jgi:uncharacterized membrane protein
MEANMILLIAGLLIFSVIHFVPSFPGVKSAFQERLGTLGYRGVFSGISLVALLLMIYGYADAQPQSPDVWTPPSWGRDVTPVLVLLAFILLASTYLRGNIARTVRHPMTFSVIIWAGAHLLVNPTQADVVLFGGILAWAIAAILFAFARDKELRFATGATAMRNDVLAIVVGVIAYILFVWRAHEWLFGVQPIP